MESPGLTSGRARELLARHGPNELEGSEARSWSRILQGIAREPMFMLLLGAAVTYLLIGDLGGGLLLAAFAALSVLLVVLQERRTERALDALRALACPQVRAFRDGRIQSIAARDLVPGDLVLLSAGDRVPADAIVREATQLGVDESLLTGESVPVRKVAAPQQAAPAAALPGGDGTPFVFAGTLAVDGHGVAEVFATGRGTRMGSIGGSLAAIDPPATPLQQNVRRLAGRLGVGALSLAATLVLWYGTVQRDWVQGVLSGIAAAMAMLPEEFPMVLTVFLALGAWRMAQVKVLARRPAVIEALGGATMLCVDKTGTLTENRMRLRRLVADGIDVDLAAATDVPEGVHGLLEFAMLASHRGGVEPMDRAILESGDRTLAGSERLHPDWALQREYPIAPGLLAVSQLWLTSRGDSRVAAKGAPEAVAGLCHLDAAATEAAMARVRELAASGLRVLGVAQATPVSALPAVGQHDYEFRWLGLAAFEDPLRADVPKAVAQARGAGIAVAMLTGDHAATALAIARQAGIEVEAGAMTGEQIAALDDAALREALRRIRVFARVMPEQKLRLVQAFAANGEVVAMTGDGVNDAPALKAAHIGIAMGQRGTDVAREAAGLVLLVEDFGRIVAAVRTGRQIFDNLRRAMTYIVAIHVPIAGLALLPLLLGLPPLMLPAHVVLTEMVIDPMCSLAFEGAPQERAIMHRPPRRADDPLVGWPLVWRGAVQGGLVLATSLTCYAIALQSCSTESARSLAITTLMAGNLGLVLLNAGGGLPAAWLFRRTGLAFWVVSTAGVSALALALTLPAARALLQFGVVPAADVAIAAAAGAAAVLAAALLRAAKPPLIPASDDS